MLNNTPTLSEYLYPYTLGSLGHVRDANDDINQPNFYPHPEVHYLRQTYCQPNQS
jgi:hypothetical protein